LIIYNLNNAKALHVAGRLWSDTTMIDLFFVTFVICGFFEITRNCKIPYNEIDTEKEKNAPFKMDRTTTIVKVLCIEYDFVRNLTDTCNDDYGAGKKSGDDQSTYKGKATL
jgi:hypothetical protein